MLRISKRYSGIYQKIKKLKHFINYSLGTVLSRGLVYVGSFLFAYLLTPEEYGEYAVFASIVPFIVVLSSMNLPSAIRQYEYKYGNFSGLFIKNSFLAILVFQSINLLFFILYEERILSLINLPNDYTLLIILLIIFGPFHMIGEQFFLGKNLSLNHLKLGLFRSTTEILSAALFILVLDYSGIFRSLGISISYLLSGILSIILIKPYLQEKFILKKEYLFYSLSFGIPIIIHQLSNNILASSDRIIISRIIGLNDSGIYSFAYSISSLIFILVLAVNQATLKKYYSLLNKSDFLQIAKHFEKFNRILIVFCILASIGLTIIYYYIAPAEYLKGIDILSVVVYSSLGIFCYLFYVNINFFKNKILTISIGTLMIASLNIFLNVLFVERFGILSAAVTTFICYFLLAVYNYIIAKKINFTKSYLSVRPIVKNFTIGGFLIFISLLIPASKYLITNLGIQTIILIIIVLTFIDWKKPFSI